MPDNLSKMNNFHLCDIMRGISKDQWNFWKEVGVIVKEKFSNECPE